MDTVQKDSDEWARNLAKIYETEQWATVIDPHFPIFPWIAPRIPAQLRALILTHGETRKIEEGGYIIPPGKSVNKVSIVIEGFTARSLVSPLGVESNGIGIAPPQHIASGNLNFFSGRPCFGNYYALTPTTIAQCPTDKLRKEVEKDPEVLLLGCKQLEGCALSDRFSFGCQGILDSEDKIKAFICGWTANFGHNLMDPNLQKIEIPSLPPYKLLGKICTVNWLIVKGIFNRWKDEGNWEEKEGGAIFSMSLLDNIYRWLTREGKEFYPLGYPETLTDLLALKESGYDPCYLKSP